MRFTRTASALLFALCIRPTAANSNDLCGPAPALSGAETSRRVEEAVFRLMISSAAGEGFARHAADTYQELASTRPPSEARRLAVALLHGYCLQLVRDRDLSRLSWHVKAHIIGSRSSCETSARRTP